MNKKNVLALSIAALSLGLIAFNNASTAGESQAKGEKSLAWYVANLKDAQKQNKECHDNPNIQATPDCVNSLHALEISFKGGN